jgi:site-specific DNA-methyltransferase (adenine-specific)
VSASVILGDFFEVADTLPKADLVVLDPPYGTTSLPWDKWDDRLLPRLLDSVKDNGSVWLFAPVKVLLERVVDLRGWSLVQDVVWEKHNGSGFINDRFRKTHETIIHLRKSVGRWSDIHRDPVMTLDASPKVVLRKTRPTHMGRIENAAYASHDGGPKLMRSVLKVRSCHGSAQHPTQKPIDLLARLIAYSCPPGGLVLDPMCGSGSTLVAASAIGRRSIGVEVNADYFKAAKARVDGAEINEYCRDWKTRSELA